MIAIGKLMILAGLVLMVIGLIAWALGKMGFHGLPGDIRYQGQNVQFYFPVVTCIVLSALLTLGLWLWQWFSRR